MKAIGNSFKKISIERKSEPQDKKININTDVQVKNVKKQTTDIFKDKDTFIIDYEYKINYEPNMANILFTGSVVFLMEDNEKELSKKVLEEWKKEKIPEDFKIPLFNVIFARCNLKALQLEEYLNLPLHIPNPRISKQQ